MKEGGEKVNFKDILKRVTIGKSPLTGNIYIGIVDTKEKNMFVEKRKLTDEEIERLKKYLEEE